MTHLSDISIFNQDDVDTGEGLEDVSGDDEEEPLAEDENLEEEGLEDEKYLGDEK